MEVCQPVGSHVAPTRLSSWCPLVPKSVGLGLCTVVGTICSAPRCHFAWVPALVPFHFFLADLWVRRCEGTDVVCCACQGSFDEYFAEMPWIALPYADRKRKEALSTLCGVEGIPTLAIIDKDGRIITTNGRGIPEMDPEGKQVWHPRSAVRGTCNPPPLGREQCSC